MGSFIAALSALRAHQSWIDVIGNNLANSNTPGFKSSRAVFSDLLSVTLKGAKAPTSTNGGTNPVQVGLGVELSSVQRNLGQGGLNVTGRTFDLAVLGRGFFAVDDGVQTLYTRVGSFGLDSGGNMVDQRTGFRVLDATGKTFAIDTKAVFPPKGTSKASLSGNLPAVITGPLAEVLTSSSPFTEGTAASTTGTAQGPFTIPAGEAWTMELVVNGGAPQKVSILGTGTMTAQEIADQIEAQTDHVEATVGPNQELVLTSDKSGLGSSIAIDPGETGKDLKSLLGLADFVQGSEFPATAATDLNALSSNIADYSTGDAISISGTDADGSPVVASFQYGVDGTTVGELAAFLDAQFQGSTATFNASTGQIVVTADATGEAELSLSILDGSSQSGKTDWSEHAFSVTTEGAGPDEVTTSLEVFDPAGTSHVLTGTFTRQDDGSWILEFELPPSEGTIVSGTIQGIVFNEDGSIQTPTIGDVVVQFGSSSPQTVTLDLGTAGGFDGLTQFGSPGGVVVDSQDGFGAGTLGSMNVDEQGTIEGFYTNGKSQVLGSFGLATFVNAAGLEEIGDNYLRETPNSGARTLGAGKTSGAGEIVGGAIEGSNVDTAEEFVHLIQAQRGFQANARVVTVQDQLLAEIVNVV